jgi:ankyrin repeat protein
MAGDYSGNFIGGTPLHIAVQFGREDVAKLLLARKADINTKDTFGDTPLHRAAKHCNKGMAEMLLAHGAKVNPQNNYIAGRLLPHGAEVNASSDTGTTPLKLAAMCVNKDIAELLRQHGGHE